MRGWRAGLLLAVCGVAATAGAVSYQGERALGQQFDLAARTQTRLLDAPEVVAYVSGIGGRIAAALGVGHKHHSAAQHPDQVDTLLAVLQACVVLCNH